MDIPYIPWIFPRIDAANTFLLWLGDLSADGLHELLAVLGDLAVLALVVALLLANLLGLLHAPVLVDRVEVALLPEAKKKLNCLNVYSAFWRTYSVTVSHSFSATWLYWMSLICLQSWR